MLINVATSQVPVL